jgi:hypothetical protein
MQGLAPDMTSCGVPRVHTFRGVGLGAEEGTSTPIGRGAKDKHSRPLPFTPATR